METNVPVRCARCGMTADQQLAFNTLKAEVSTEGMELRHHDPTKPLILHTGWLVEGKGAVLGQIDD
eukprot:1154411-Pelagomonas_calceolata.AAC.4